MRKQKGTELFSKKKKYRIYNLGEKKIVIRRDMQFDEHVYWNWNFNKVHNSYQTTQSVPKVSSLLDDERSSDIPVLKVKYLSDVYDRCNLVNAKPTSYKEAAQKSEPVQAMKVEIDATERNKYGS